MNNYNDFREMNDTVYADGNTSIIVDVNLKQNTCICANSSRQTYYLLPIELLISEMKNDMCHINDFTKLRDWKGFEDEDVVERCNNAYYPEDYMDNTEKYIVDITDLYANNNDNTAKIYDTIGKRVANNYEDDILGFQEEQETGMDAKTIRDLTIEDMEELGIYDEDEYDEI